MINNVRRKHGTPLIGLIAMFMLLISAGAGSAAAQGGEGTVSINSYSCPADYDQISDCMKIGGVSVRVTTDTPASTDVVTVAESPVDVTVVAGSNVTVEVLSGAPTGSVLEPTALQFVAVEGANPITLVFVDPQSNDTDGDGLTDDEEAALGTDPADADSDDDGVLDGGEVNAGTDPLDEDSDDDGFLDFEELERGTDPLDPASFPVDAEPNSVTVTVYNCPAGYDGKELWDDCTELATGVDFAFYLNASEFGLNGTTDSTGTVSFGDLGGGIFTLQEDLTDLDFELQRYTASCFAEPLSPNAPEPRQVNAYPLSDGAYGFELSSGEDVTCTWFNIPLADDAAPKPTPTPSTPVKRLPSTGSSSGTDGATISDGAIAISGAFAVSALIAALGIRITRRRA